ncbi:hypothetical protein FH965_00690 [Streptomyces spectabilis]|uniref:Cyclodipeptide synthase n=1 Tax=Streptomyces spectabilis TaxID=68270 RepID=A0A516RK84_STRST|nr:hypothetical protein FH965_00690 [Streptomyces spectabilis]
MRPDRGVLGDGRRLARLAQHACVGVSPFSSCFKRARVAELCRWALPRFAETLAPGPQIQATAGDPDS